MMIMLGSQKSSGSPSPSPSPSPSSSLSPSLPPLSVHDLLDHTWHYECVVSPTYSSSNPSSPAAAMAINTIPSQYVSLSSFLHPTTIHTTSATATHTAPSSITTSSSTSSSSNCRDAERIRHGKMMHPTYAAASSSGSAASASSTSRAAFISPFLALDY